MVNEYQVVENHTNFIDLPPDPFVNYIGILDRNDFPVLVHHHQWSESLQIFGRKRVSIASLGIYKQFGTIPNSIKSSGKQKNYQLAPFFLESPSYSKLTKIEKSRKS